MAAIRLKSVYVNLSCGQPESRLFNVQWPVDGRAVTADDIKRVVREARGRAMSEGRATNHALPLSFSTDARPGALSGPWSGSDLDAFAFIVRSSTRNPTTTHRHRNQSAPDGT